MPKKKKTKKNLLLKSENLLKPDRNLFRDEEATQGLMEKMYECRKIVRLPIIIFV